MLYSVQCPRARNFHRGRGYGRDWFSYGRINRFSLQLGNWWNNIFQERCSINKIEQERIYYPRNILSLPMGQKLYLQSWIADQPLKKNNENVFRKHFFIYFVLKLQTSFIVVDLVCICTAWICIGVWISWIRIRIGYADPDLDPRSKESDQN